MGRISVLLAAITIGVFCVPSCRDRSVGNESVCGNGEKEREEPCDGPDLGGQTCQTFGFTTGELSCTAECALDSSDCSTCGNGVAESREECDGQDLAAQTCVQLGYTGGALSCLPECTLDESGCYSDCGNNVAETGEECDGQDLRGQTCEDLGHDGGVLACLDCDYDETNCSDCGNGTMEADEECDDGNQTDWDGCTQCISTEFQVNQEWIDDQQDPTVAVAWDGSFVVVWQFCEYTMSPPGRAAILARRFDSGGNPLTDEFQVNSTDWGNSAGCQGAGPDVSVAGDGSFVVAWAGLREDNTLGGVARQFDMAGTPLTPELPVSPGLPDRQLSIATAPDRFFVVAWDVAPPLGAYAQCFQPDGTSMGDGFLINSTGDYGHPSVGVAMDHSFVVVWHQRDPNKVFGQRYDSQCQSLGNSFEIGDPATSRSNPAVAMTTDGTGVVVFQGPSVSFPDVLAVRYDSNWNPLGPQFPINQQTTGSQHDPDVAILGDGSFAVVWNRDFDDVFARRFASDGSALGNEFQVHVFDQNDQLLGAVGLTPDGKLVAVWMSMGQDQNLWGVFARVFPQP